MSKPAIQSQDLNADQQSCARFGFRPGTDSMARCLLDIELDRRAERRARGSQRKGPVNLIRRARARKKQ